MGTALNPPAGGAQSGEQPTAMPSPRAAPWDAGQGLWAGPPSHGAQELFLPMHREALPAPSPERPTWSSPLSLSDGEWGGSYRSPRWPPTTCVRQ